MWHWLVHNGLYASLVSTVVFIVLTGAVVPLIRRALRRAVHQQTQQLAQIVRLLDTNSPGGLADVVAAVRSEGEHDRPSTSAG